MAPVSRPIPLEEAASPSLPGAAPPVRQPDWRLTAFAVTLLGAAYVWWHLSRGWIPHDEGTLGQPAMRVLAGELPHRDFDDTYTGGLAFLNAAAFRVFGERLFSMRLPLFGLFLVWIPAFFYSASRFVAPLAAAAVTAVAVTWTLPNYPAALPSWYNLFLATLGVAALLRHVDTGDRRWLWVAGFVGGLSCLAKIIGLYYLGGALLFLVFHEHSVSHAAQRNGAERGLAYSVFVTAGLTVFVVALLLLVRKQLHAAEFVQFVLPGGLVAAYVAYVEWVQAAGSSKHRFAALARLLWPFLLGAAVPICIFLIPYATSGALADLYRGIFVLPTLRFGFAAQPAMPLAWTLTLLPVVLAIAWGARRKPDVRPVGLVIAAAIVVSLLIATGRASLAYRVVWLASFSVLPIVVTAGVIAVSRHGDGRDALLRERTMVLLAVTAVCGLVQFPYAVPIYLCYVVPLIVLTATALFRYLPPITPAIPGAIVTFLVGFAVLRTNASEITTFGNAFIPYPPVAALAGERGGLDVRADAAALYNQLIARLREHARGGYTWASPDTPEIYVLAGLKNPTRSLFEFFDDTTGRTQRILAGLERHGVTAIVLNSQPAFSPPITRGMYRELIARFPHSENIGFFQLRWRE